MATLPLERGLFIACATPRRRRSIEAAPTRWNSQPPNSGGNSLTTGTWKATPYGQWSRYSRRSAPPLGSPHPCPPGRRHPVRTVRPWAWLPGAGLRAAERAAKHHRARPAHWLRRHWPLNGTCTSSPATRSVPTQKLPGRTAPSPTILGCWTPPRTAAKLAPRYYSHAGIPAESARQSAGSHLEIHYRRQRLSNLPVLRRGGNNPCPLPTSKTPAKLSAA